MSLNLTICCISGRDPGLIAALLVCGAADVLAGALLGRAGACRRAKGRGAAPFLVAWAGILLVASPIAVASITQLTASVVSPGVMICFAFVRRLLHLPGLGGVASMLVFAAPFHR